MTNCPACNGSNSSIFTDRPRDLEYFVTRSAPAKIMQCMNCSSLYQTPWPQLSETNSFYPDDYQNYQRADVPLLSDLLSLFVRRAAKSFALRVGLQKRILDFGCGDGSFLRALAALGAEQLVGYEPHHRQYVTKDDVGVPIHESLEELIKAGPFDVVRMNHVIEHLSDLDGTMKLLSQILRPDGLVFVQTPNPASGTCKIFGRYWGPLHYPYHTILFTPKGMKDAAKRWDLIVDSVAGAMMPTGWSMSIENLIKGGFSIRRRGRLPIYGILVFATVPAVFLERAIAGSNSSVIDYVLRKTR